MKKLNLLTVLIMLAVASVSFGQGISLSAHDFSAVGWNTSGEICITCHTPHDASIEPDSPLWNHELSAATYTVYNSSTLDADAGSLGDPDGSSKLCLSCHDGTVALDSFGGSTGSTNIVAGRKVGPDLSHEHPISFLYDQALATLDGELFDPTTALGVGTSTIQNSMLTSNKMQCSSCHDVHDKLGNLKLLVKSNSASALCLTCHNK